MSTARRLNKQFAWRVWLIWLALLPTTWSTVALAQVHYGEHEAISASAWLSDPTGQLGPDQVRQMAWTPYTGRLRLGYTSGTTWVRLTVLPAAHDTSPQNLLVLRIQPGQLDEIALFDPRQPGQPPQITGDRHDWRLGQYRSLNHNLMVPAPTVPTELLLRLRTTSHHGLDVQALSWNEAQQQDTNQLLGVGALCAVALMVLVWSGWLWWRTRERLSRVFFVQQAITALGIFSLLGIYRVYLSAWLPASLLDAITSWTFPLSHAVTVWFHWHFLREFNPPRSGMRFLKALMAMLPLQWLLLLSGHTATAMLINTLLVSLTSPLLLLLVWFIAPLRYRDAHQLSRRYLLMIYGLLLLIVFSLTLPALGWVPSLPWGTATVPLCTLLSALLMAGALGTRAKRQRAKQQEAQTAMKMAQQHSVLERSRREEKEHFLAMLTHELTSPLAVASLAIGGLSPSSSMRARGYLAIDNMRAIIENCARAVRLDAPGQLVQRTTVDVEVLLQELRTQLQAKYPTGAHIALHLPNPLTPCQIDRSMLAVILGNLMENALKYGVGNVTVTAQEKQRGVQAGLQFSVRNAEGAMGRPDPAHLFEKYHRGRAAMRQSGSGLGLYLSSQTAQLLGGELVYRADEISDVIFDLWVPA